MAGLDCKKPKLCTPEPVPEPKPCSEAFAVCVGDRVLKWDGFCLSIDREKETPDGTYTAVTVKDGCIVEYGHADVPTYTPPYCNPNPTHCQDTEGTSGVTISSDKGNSLKQTSSGLFSRTYIQNGDGVAISGDGTVNSPYKVSTTSRTAGVSTVIVGRNGIEHKEVAEGVVYIGLEESGVAKGVYDITDQFTVDEFGRIVAVEERENPLIIAGAGLETEPSGDGVEIKHEPHDIEPELVLGAYTVKTNNTGHITETERNIILEAKVYKLGAYIVGINSYGSISNIKQSDQVVDGAGGFKTSDGKTVSYDDTGRIVGVVSSYEVPMPIRDMYRVLFTQGVSGGVAMEAYGKSTSITAQGNDVHIALLDYVISKEQVAVNGANSWSIDLVQRVLIVRPVDGSVFTVTFRG